MDTSSYKLQEPPATAHDLPQTPAPKIAARLFLVGCPRSGTTLLQSLLSAHPQVLSFPETHFYSHMPSSNRILRRLGLARWDAPVRFSQLLGTLGLPPVKAGGWSVASYLRRLVAALDKATLEAGKTVWLEKTPRHLYYLDAIARTLPDAKFIHLVRSGPDVVASLYEVTHEYPELWGGQRSLELCVARWIKDIDISRRYQGKCHHFTVRYEALVDDPAASLRDLFDFIGVPADEAVLTRIKMDYRGAAKRVIAPGETWKATVQEDIERRQQKFMRFTAANQAYVLERTRPHEGSLP